MAFNAGMEMRIKGVPNYNPIRFSIDVGLSNGWLGMHIDLRFDYFNEVRTIVMNSLDSEWGEELRETSFPFEAGKEFEMTISFNVHRFYINLHNGKIIEFPNRLKITQYNNLSMEGDVKVHSLIIL